MLKVLAMTAVAMSGAAMAAGDLSMPPGIQYGALGLAGFLVWWLTRYVQKKDAEHSKERLRLVAALERKEEKNSKLVEANTEAFNHLANVLDTRPCLHGAEALPKD